MTHSPQTPPPSGPRKVIYLRRARCPACDSIRLLTYKSVTQPDGAVLRYVRCKTCAHLFQVILE